ncbi:Type III restriction-modification system methylation subunit [Lactococcus cremoris]|uniref:Type III restriction-modification system methylation subunit n=1 Tax=Lactococcus lactis subsp. cremoris TaxID=1359 RepID=A0A161W057_LACLC|nr:site-specific DNA-methyltransferase [Lactococcus cremoris]KZK05288.1 Type III restriction-modification system methylation subunit [Lactococcus cremoris]
MRAKIQEENKNSFTERPHENEKKRALDYVEKLLEEARLDPTSRSEDIAELTEIHRLLNNKKYGLVWEEHAEKVEEEMKTKIPVFVEDESKKISDNPDSEDYNFLLEGDNLHSLHLLEKTHAGKIDVIYIDPPYNTGNKDFKYNDAFVDKTDTFSHSKWLSFMECRLNIARLLLSDKGVIFISIDENEVDNLSKLIEGIFGDKNVLQKIIWRKKYTGGKNSGSYVDMHEYILSAVKNNSSMPKMLVERPSTEKGKFNQSDEYESARGKFYTRPLKSNLDPRPTLVYPIECPDGTVQETQWIVAQNTFMNMVNEGRIEFKKKRDGTYSINKKYYEKDGGGKVMIPSILDFVSNNDAKEEMKRIFNIRQSRDLPFSTPKPSKLLKYIFSAFQKNVTILDFFAGSGTTGQAVIELNREDGGNRKFILATNNENNIAEEVTYERMKRVSAGTEKYKAHPMNLKYFKTAMINKEDENLEKTLLSNVKTLIELQHGVDLSNSKIAVVVNRKQAEELSVTGLSTVYMRGLTHQMLDEELAIKFSDVKIIDIPETYFPLELKEAGF